MGWNLGLASLKRHPTRASMASLSMYTSASVIWFEVSYILDRIARVWHGAGFWDDAAEDREDITKIDAEMQNFWIDFG